MNNRRNIKKRALLGLFMACMPTYYMHTMDNSQRNCIILIDHDDNDNVGRFVWFLMSRIQSAIAEQSTPLLMSASLWNSFIERRINFKQNLERGNNPLYEIYNLYQTINERIEFLSNYYNDLSCDVIQNKKLIAQSINKEFYDNKKTISAANYQLLLNYSTYFNPEDWEIYKNNNGFYLFIPKKYSAQNSLVGFKIDSLEKVDHPEDSSYIYFESCVKKSITDALPDFFLTYDNFTDENMPYTWNIVVAGHGGSKYSETNDNEIIRWVGEPIIADLTVQEFNNMLRFFQSSVKTNLFHYSSCYAAGNHISLIFNDSQKKPYNFAIICDNLTDCATYCKWITLLPSDEKQYISTADLIYNSTKNCWELPLLPTYHWDNFFKKIKSIDFSIGSVECLQNILSSITYPMIANIPLLCLPGTNTFFPLQPSDGIKIDDQLLALAQTEDDCITINKVKTILLESTYIIPTITLNHSDQLRIISIKPGNALHYIKKLESNCSIDLSSTFWQAQYQCYDKIFILDECTFPYSYDFKHMFPPTNQITLQNIIISQKKDQLSRIFFTFENKAMMIVAHKPIEEDEKTTIQEIITMTTEAQNKYEEHYSLLKKAAVTQSTM